jgi:hypothetical protein
MDTKSTIISAVTFAFFWVGEKKGSRINLLADQIRKDKQTDRKKEPQERDRADRQSTERRSSRSCQCQSVPSDYNLL